MRSGHLAPAVQRLDRPVVVGIDLRAAPGVDDAGHAQPVQLPHELAGRDLLVLGVELRPQPQRLVEDRGVRPGDEHPGRLAPLVPLDGAARRLGRVLRVADGPQRRPVQQRPVVQVQDEDGRVGGGGVDLLQRGHPPLGELELAPAADDPHPLRRRGAAGLLPEHPQGVGEARHAVPAQLHVEAEAAPDQVRVGIGQPGHGPPAAQVDDRRPRAAEVHQGLLVGADRQDPLALDGQGGRRRVGRVQGRELPAMKDEVGVLVEIHGRPLLRTVRDVPACRPAAGTHFFAVRAV